MYFYFYVINHCNLMFKTYPDFLAMLQSIEILNYAYNVEKETQYFFQIKFSKAKRGIRKKYAS